MIDVRFSTEHFTMFMTYHLKYLLSLKFVFNVFFFLLRNKNKVIFPVLPNFMLLYYQGIVLKTLGTIDLF